MYSKKNPQWAILPANSKWMQQDPHNSPSHV